MLYSHLLPVILIEFYFVVKSASHAPEIECQCNTQLDICDLNCCCDPECTFDERAMFTTCDDTTLKYRNRKACVDSSLVFRTNIPAYVFTEIGNSLLCVYWDNAITATVLKRGSYYDYVEPFQTLDEFYQVHEQFAQHKYFNADQTARTYSSYKSGDPVLTVSGADATLGYLPMPAVGASSMKCVDANPVAYLIEEEYTCTRMITDLVEQCNSDRALKASTFYEGFRVVQNSGKLAKLRTGNLAAVSEDSIPVTVDLDRCVSVNDSKQQDKCVLVANAVPSPTLTHQTGRCENVVAQVVYTIGWRADKGVTSVKVGFKLVALQAGTRSSAQTFRTVFVKDSAPVQTDQWQISNYGYLVGSPLRAGKPALDDGFTTGNASMNVSEADGGLTMLSGSADGWCSESSTRVPITFGINMYSGCFIRQTSNQLADYCQLTQSQVLQALRGPEANLTDHIAMFAHSKTSRPQHWTKIRGIETEPRKAVRHGSMCQDMLVGLDIGIFFGRVGYVENLQTQIIAAHFDYVYAKELNIMCRDVTGCERHLATVSVSFHEVTSSPRSVV